MSQILQFSNLLETFSRNYLGKLDKNLRSALQNLQRYLSFYAEYSIIIPKNETILNPL